MMLMNWFKEPDALFVVEIPVTITKRQESYIFHYRHSADLETIPTLPHLFLNGVVVAVTQGQLKCLASFS